MRLRRLHERAEVAGEDHRGEDQSIVVVDAHVAAHRVGLMADVLMVGWGWLRATERDKFTVFVRRPWLPR
jgi:hypothetical protein